MLFTGVKMFGKVALNQNQLKRFFNLFAGAVLFSSTGCNLCCPPYMDDYATVGGKWARANPTEGRVGSAFSDPGTLTASAELPEYPSFESTEETTIHQTIEPMPDPAADAPIILGDDW
jgi:hypothetical protein